MDRTAHGRPAQPAGVLSAHGTRAWRFAISLEGGVPAVLEVRVFLEIGSCDFAIRAPAIEQEAARRLLDRIKGKALELVPAAPACMVTEADDGLPF